ncbi:SDR family NAD(P)-dependent oxidoreductase [Actinomadura viridis]|uniref:type I polyketide synthase n=1 Tax=Actinomadura viridis TaxID=58110 RepID=UPI003689218D
MTLPTRPDTADTADTADTGGTGDGDDLDIAVVGLACRFPGAPDAEAYWDVIRTGTETITRLTPARMRAAGASERRLAEPGLVPAAGLIDGGTLFDAAFFGYPAREAAEMDPQQRMFLESCRHALDDAGYDAGGFPGRIGVYAGQTVGTHRPRSLDAFLGTAGDLLMAADDKDFLTTRVAYKLGLTGPAVTVQTACSTSLVAVHMACQALNTLDCDLALAGGVSWSPLRGQGYLHQPGGVWSADGHMRPFDRDASGFVASDGLGVIALRRLADARAGGDRVYAVVKGGAINNDGADKASFAAPGVPGQVRVIAAALRAASVDPGGIGYVEAHGSATAVGDAIEVAALNEAYRAAGATGSGGCALGSVKANIGHADAAAGVAGFIKAALMLYHRRLPPPVNLRAPNPELDLDGSPFTLDPAPGDWPRRAGQPRRAAVSAFGIGGTNAHVVLQEPPEPAAATAPSRPWQLLCLSARDEPALGATAAMAADRLRDHAATAPPGEADPADATPADARPPDPRLADIAHTLTDGRRHFPHRLAGVFTDLSQAAGALGRSRVAPPLVQGDATRPPGEIVFMFPGGGSQHPGMGHGLAAAFPAYRDALEEGLALLDEPLRRTVRALLAPSSGRSPHPPGPADKALEDPAAALPAVFLAQVAMARQLMDLGPHPTVLLGHSLGEYAAAHLAGVFTLGDALKIVTERGRLLAGIPGGAMLSVPAAPAELGPLPGDAGLAAVNGPASCVVTGPVDDIERVERRLGERGVACRRLPLATAAHSPLVDGHLPGFRAFLDQIDLSPPVIPVISPSYGRAVTARLADREYWVRHLRESVRFDGALDHAFTLGRPALIDLGPGTALAALARAHTRKSRAHTVVAAARHPSDDRPDAQVFLEAAGALWAAGADIDPSVLHRGERRARLPVVRYPFARTDHPVPGAASPQATPPETSQETAEEARLYAVAWKRVQSPPGTAPADAARHAWVVLSDGSALAGAVTAGLRERGAEPVVIVPEGAPVDAGDHPAEHHRADPRDPGWFRAALTGRGADVNGTGRPVRVVDLWCARPSGAVAPLDDVLGIARGADGLPGIEVLLVTRQAHDVLGTETVEPYGALATGAGYSVAVENPSVRVRALDLHHPGDAAAEAARVLAEFAVPASGAPIALRGAHRWERAFVPYDAPGAAPGAAPAAESGPDGAHVIVGGTGGIGRLLAEHLVNRHRARVVVAGRGCADGRPKPGLWTRRADVTDEEGMTALLREAERLHGRVRCVVHAAGTPGGGLAAMFGRAEAEETLRAKVTGARALTRAVQAAGVRVGQVVYFSSLAAFTGAPGLSGYGAANAWLDAHAAHSTRELGVPAVSVGWDRWRGVGMAAAVEERHRALSGHDLAGGLDAAAALAAFDRVLADRITGQVVVSAGPPGRVPAPTAPPSPGGHRPGGSAPRGDLEERLAGIWKDVLGVGEIGVEDDFFGLGGHSVMALQLAGRCRDRLGLDVTAPMIFKARTIAGLAGRLRARDRSARS